MRVVPLFLCLLPFGVNAQGGLKGPIGAAYSVEDLKPNPPLSSVPGPALGDVTRNFISATLGSNMVLQRDEETILWGYSQPGATITTSLHNNGETEEQARLEVTNTAQGDDGLWRQTLPPQPASLKASAITIKSTTGEKHTLENVLFGDVYICGGQSNMVFSLPANTNGTEEAAKGENYKHIRVFTVGQGTQSATPMPDLQTVEQKWSVAGKDSLFDSGPKGGFGFFSSVCWFFGKELSDGLDNQVPLGLISNNWGGTQVELWQPGGKLYNAMIYPYMVGPMKLTGFTWYQGEANAKGQQAADSYAQRFPSMIESWRKGFQVPDAYFGFVQLSTWCPDQPLVVPELRQAQMAALKLTGKIGYATNADHGAGCNIHPPPKQYCGARLGKSALALQYGKQIQWQSPSYVGGTTALRSTAGQPASIAIELKDVSSKGLYLLDTPYNLLPEADMACDKKPEGTCEGANVLLNGKGWVKASVSIQDNNHVVLTASEGGGTDSIVATSYGWGSVPLVTLYDAGTELPVLPWNKKV